MAEPSRGLKISRRSWLLAGLGVGLSRGWAADSLTVTFDGDNLHLAAPDLHFLTGKPLKRLKDGSTVIFDANVRLFADAFVTAIRRAEVQFAISYDVLSDDKFAVTILGGGRRSATNLSAAATEAWCIENMFINAADLSPDRRLWLQLDLWVVNKSKLSSVLGDSVISIVPLIEMLGKDPKAVESPITRQSGPWRIADLGRTPGRGRNG